MPGLIMLHLVDNDRLAVIHRDRPCVIAQDRVWFSVEISDHFAGSNTMSAFIHRGLPDLGLLILRVGIAGMMIFGHGWGKLVDFAARSGKFPDPFGIGSTASLALAVFGEVVCAALLAVGLFTRLAAVPFLITMLVAAFVIHGDDPFAKKELALLYALPALMLIATGPGGLSIDGWRKRG